MKRQLTTEKILYALVGIFVMTYATMRAFYVPFTIDEESSFRLIDILGVRLQSKVNVGTHTYLAFDLNGFSLLRVANSHYLNSLLMKVCSLLFGNSELSLRLPNIISLLFYIIFSYKIAGYIDDRYLRFCGFLVLMLNPFMLDFFSLARGYGMATSLAIIALYYFMSFISGKREAVFYAYLFAMLSSYANFIAFNFYVAILSVNLVFVIFRNGVQIPVLLSLVKKNKRIVILNILYLLITLPFLFLQVATDQFYIGGKTIYSIFYSLSVSSLYERAGIETVACVLSVSCICLSVFLTIVNARRVIKVKNISPDMVPFLILSVSFVVCIFQHLLLKLPLPEKRTGIYFIPLFVIAMMFSYLQTGKNIRRYLRPLLIVAAFLSVVNLSYSMNLRYAVYSIADANVKEVYNYLKKEAEKRDAVISVNVDCGLANALDYYRRIDNNNEKLKIVYIWQGGYLTQDTNACYYYLFDTTKALMPAHTNVLLSFPHEMSSIRHKVNCD